MLTKTRVGAIAHHMLNLEFRHGWCHEVVCTSFADGFTGVESKNISEEGHWPHITTHDPKKLK
jgi:hypothetical protein